ncbi:MAG: FtsX-like permease family protein [Acidobacteria bacterium]|nr:FtsX-like permease family protein [Acidobacteriota bacterium]
MREPTTSWIGRNFRLFVAFRYMKTRREQAFTSVVTGVSILGVIVGVAALIIALALLTGFQDDIQDKLIGANSHIFVQSWGGLVEDPDFVAETAAGVDGVVAAAPAFVMNGLIQGGASGSSFVNLKGVDPRGEAETSQLLDRLIEGSATHLTESGSGGGRPGIILGSELGTDVFVQIGESVKVMIYVPGMLTPWGAGGPKFEEFEVVGFFDVGMYEYDKTWALIPLETAQRLAETTGGVSWVQVKVEDAFNTAPVVKELGDRLGNDYHLLDWQTQNQAYFAALELEKLALFVTISLIVTVAALNIVATLVLMIKDKQRDIGILMALGATRRDILTVFMTQGLVIGLVGTAVGLFLGVTIALLLDHYEAIRLQAQVYYLSYVPFHVRVSDSTRVCVFAVLVSFAATFYPAWRASRLDPVVSLRYE